MCQAKWMLGLNKNPVVIFASFDGSNKNRQVQILIIFDFYLFEVNYDAFKHRAEVIEKISEAARQKGEATVIQDGYTEYVFDDASVSQDILDACKCLVRDHKSWSEAQYIH